jgi:hypothetical protein
MHQLLYMIWQVIYNLKKKSKNKKIIEINISSINDIEKKSEIKSFTNYNLFLKCVKNIK